MSLYNMLFGQNLNSDVVLAILGFRSNNVERFRDCGFDDNGIFIHTRTGGGNREDYPNEALIESPYYLSDEDDEFDSTYATYHFKFPDEIKEDCERFKDVRANGISAKFIQWVLKTLEREPTKDDIASDLWGEQNRLVRQSKQTFIFETNGHTIVPLDDYSLEKYLSLMEKNEGNQLSYDVKPYQLKVEENVAKWSNIKNNEMCRVKVDIVKNWPIDNALWSHWQERFAEKYPKAIATIRDSVDRYNAKST